MPKLTTPPSENGHANNGHSTDYSKLFGWFGVVFHRNGSAEALADACPWCGKDKFSLNVTTGEYHCKHCAEGSGNHWTFLRWAYGEALKGTTADRYSALGKKRGIAPQTLKRHGLAYDEGGARWLIPFKNAEGNVVNLQLYYPDAPKGQTKQNLPGLSTAIYGFEQLAKDKERPVLICEGPFDAIALDYSLGANNRAKYAIVATPGTFKEAWAPHFRGRKVRAFYDNDKGGEQHRERVRKLLGVSGVAAELKVLKWPDGTPDGYDVNDLIREPQFKGKSVLGFLDEHCVEVTAEPKLDVQRGRDRKPGDDREDRDWPWPDHLMCGTYVSYSGRRGTLKSTVMRELVALYTTGRPMPGQEAPGMPAGNVIYITAEDDRKEVWDSLDLAGADTDRVNVIKATLKDGDPLNVLEHLPELENLIREDGVRLVIIDGQNSVVGAPNISTDMLARHNVSNKLHQFAQRLDICLVGIRNEDAEGRALGPQSMGDLARCILRSTEIHGAPDGERYFRLSFERVSNRSQKLYPPIPYSVEDLGGSSRRILWGKEKPPDPKAVPAPPGQAEQVRAVVEKGLAAKAKGGRP